VSARLGGVRTGGRGRGHLLERGGVLPLGLGWRPLADPGGVRVGLVVAHVANREARLGRDLPAGRERALTGCGGYACSSCADGNSAHAVLAAFRHQSRTPGHAAAFVVCDVGARASFAKSRNASWPARLRPGHLGDAFLEAREELSLASCSPRCRTSADWSRELRPRRAARCCPERSSRERTCQRRQTLKSYWRPWSDAVVTVRSPESVRTRLCTCRRGKPS
jgi:hypothetical protein